MSESAIERINDTCNSLKELTGVDMAVAVVPEIETSIEDFAAALFHALGKNNYNQDKTVLIVVAPDKDPGVHIEPGDALETVLTDDVAKQILEEDFTPIMKEKGDLDKALSRLTAHVSNILMYSDEVKDIVSSEQDSVNFIPHSAYGPEEYFEGILILLLVIGGIAWVLTFGYYVILLLNRRKMDSYSEALKLQDAMTAFWIGACVSLGLGIMFPLLARRRLHHLRNNPRSCSRCDGKMIRLSPEEHYSKLTPAEDLEEQLETVNYDVWECSQCQYVEKFAFRSVSTDYRQCPHCGTVAMGLVADHILEIPTRGKKGTGDCVWECQYCGQDHHEEHEIEFEEEGSA